MAKKIYRSAENKVLFGVCGGIAEYFDIDPLITRLALAFFVLLGGSGIIAYLICALAIPRRPSGGAS